VPPRYAYWTIIVDNQPTAFRSASVDELIPTFNRLKSKQPNVILKWFQNGKLWDSRLDAREAQERRGEEGRKHDKRQQGGFASRPVKGALEWKPTSGEQRDRPTPEWSPRQTPTSPRPEKRARPTFKGGGFQRPSRPGHAKPQQARDQQKLEWAPRGTPATSRPEKRARPPHKGGGGERPSRPGHAKPQQARDRQKLEWAPRGTPATSRPEKRARPPYKGDPDQRDSKPRDKKWRPGGDHRDPRQKYKDAKKAKWTRFKQAIRRKRPPRKP
jgi:hypothetical protein